MLVVSALLSVDAKSEPYAYLLSDISDASGSVLTTECMISEDVEAWNGSIKNSVFYPKGCEIEDVPKVHRCDGVFVKHAGKYSWCIGIREDNKVRLLSVYGKVVDVEYNAAMRIAAEEGICNVYTDNLQLYGNCPIPVLYGTEDCVWTGAFTRVPKAGDVVAKDCFDIFGDPLVRAGDILTELQVKRLSHFCILPPILDSAGLSETSVKTLAEHSSRYYVDLGEASWLLNTVAEGKEVSLDMLRKGLPTLPTGGIAWVFRLSELDSTVAGHSLTVSQLVGSIALEVLNRKSNTVREKAMLGALLHDVGKLKVNPNVLEAGRRLTPQEFDEVKQHPQVGYELLMNSPSQEVRRVALIALRHHVKKDNRGYPPDIALSSLQELDLIVQFCDILSALLAKRQYKEPVPPMEALRIVCKEFDEYIVPKIAQRCAIAIQKGLVGATVQMRDGSYGKLIAIKNKNPVGQAVVRINGTGKHIVSDRTPDTEPVRIVGV